MAAVTELGSRLQQDERATTDIELALQTGVAAADERLRTMTATIKQELLASQERSITATEVCGATQEGRGGMMLPHTCTRCVVGQVNRRIDFTRTEGRIDEIIQRLALLEQAVADDQVCDVMWNHWGGRC